MLSCGSADEKPAIDYSCSTTGKEVCQVPNDEGIGGPYRCTKGSGETLRYSPIPGWKCSCPGKKHKGGYYEELCHCQEKGDKVSCEQTWF